MTKKDEKKDKQVRQISEEFWNRMIGRFKMKGLTTAEGIIEAGTLWMEKNS